MTQEEKAKRYDEAIRKAKDMLSYKEIRQEDIEYLFPELKESEDERIRQFLIQEVTETSDEIMSYRNMNKKSVLAWLEKQGEQKPADIDNLAKLWTIQDAKDGDVLVSKSGDKIFSYRGSLDLKGRPCAHYGIYKVHDGIRFTPCAIGNYFTYEEVYPATKEQRDLLFSKMKESGYEWNAEKKVLKKIK